VAALDDDHARAELRERARRLTLLLQGADRRAQQDLRLEDTLLRASAADASAPVWPSSETDLTGDCVSLPAGGV